MKNTLQRLIGSRILLGSIGVLVIVVGGALIVRKDQSDTTELYKVIPMTFEKQVGLSGKVVPIQTVDLAFEASGVVANVTKNVGDTAYTGETLAALDSAELQASRAKAVADLDVEQAQLAKLQSSSTGTDSTEVYNNKRAVIDSILDAYTKSDDAIRSKTDQYFKNGASVFPEIKYTFDNYLDTKDKINSKRVTLELDLVKWQSIVNSLTIDTYTPQALAATRAYINEVKDFFDLITPAVNSFKLASDLTQTSIDKYKSDLYSARANVNAALAALTSAEEKLRGSVSDIPVQTAHVKAAQAAVQSIDAQIRKTMIVAPFDGVVSLQDAKVGAAVSANTKIASLISQHNQIEIYVPEVNIIGLAVNNPASVTLDAYLDKKFTATVTHIDPAETLKDGLPNYKIKLEFSTPDAQIRSGMTANVWVMTDKRDNVLLVPERSVIRTVDGTYVYKVAAPGAQPIKTQVTLGDRDGKGSVELLGGLTSGDAILLTPAQQ